jgi:hypothetical protein
MIGKPMQKDNGNTLALFHGRKCQSAISKSSLKHIALLAIVNSHSKDLEF